MRLCYNEQGRIIYARTGGKTMRTLYIDCRMGAAGDMLTAALLELLPDPDAFISELNAIGIPGAEYRAAPSVKCGIAGTHVSVLLHGSEAACHANETVHCADRDHTGLHEIEHIISELPLSESVKTDILSVFGRIAQAESAVHGIPVPHIHFHEVGTLDAVADVTAVCMLMDRLAPDEIVVSPVHVGSGQVRCAHGILPVPAPATAEILKGVPIYGGSVDGELCTPTGAALLRHFASRFGDMPVMRTEAIGYGMGTKDFGWANCVRVLLGETEDARDSVTVLSCNIDDMTAEEIGFAMDRLLDGGAREVYTVPIGMKKNRPGTLLRVICSTADREQMAELVFRYTSTIGVRETEMGRYILERTTGEAETPYGTVRVKRSAGYGVSRRKYEYDDIARIARERGIGLREARELIESSLSR